MSAGVKFCGTIAVPVDVVIDVPEVVVKCTPPPLPFAPLEFPLPPSPPLEPFPPHPIASRPASPKKHKHLGMDHLRLGHSRSIQAHFTRCDTCDPADRGADE